METFGTDRRFMVPFLIVSAIWGSTWLATKVGVQVVPPLFFSASRLLVGGAILLALAASQGSMSWPKGRGVWVLFLSFFGITIPYSLLFWGVLNAPSGLAAVVNLALMPLALFSIGLAFGEEDYSHAKAIGVTIGIVGLIVLFVPKLMADTVPPSLWGLGAVATGTVLYCFISVLSRPLLKQSTPTIISGWLLSFGGIFMMLVSLATEPVGWHTLALYARIEIFLSWLYLAIGGMVIGFSLYTKLMRDWGPSRAGLYAFVSPVVAVFLGVVVLGETFGVYEIAGGAIMFGAAALVIRPPQLKEAMT
ncbi:MAG: EamA family transporter [Rhodospirillales bacterium]|jgi:drug/metabolite transporter (DMT)-like permease|nr:EamA family transporter [Rhodospirillales bacterium]